MITILSEKIHDNRFLRLVRNMLTAGYLEDWVLNSTLRSSSAVTRDPNRFVRPVVTIMDMASP